MNVHPDRWSEQYTKVLNQLDASEICHELSDVANLIGKLTAANRPDIIGRVVVGVLSAYAARCTDHTLDCKTASAMGAHEAAAIALLRSQ